MSPIDFHLTREPPYDHDGALYVAVFPNRGSPPAVLLRKSYREAGKIRTEPSPTCPARPPSASSTPRLLRDDNCCPPQKRWQSSTHCRGHVLAALGTARRITLDTVLPRRKPQRRRDLALALVLARLMEPAAKLATARMLDPATAAIRWTRCLGSARLPPGGYAALDWLGREQPFMEAHFAHAICRWRVAAL